MRILIMSVAGGAILLAALGAFPGYELYAIGGGALVMVLAAVAK